MPLLLENLLVGLIVAGCAVFSAWRLMSPRLRLRTLERLTPVLGKVAPGTLARLRTRTLAQLAGGGCGTCSHNKTAIHHPGRRG